MFLALLLFGAGKTCTVLDYVGFKSTKNHDPVLFWVSIVADLICIFLVIYGVRNGISDQNFIKFLFKLRIEISYVSKHSNAIQQIITN